MNDVRLIDADALMDDLENDRPENWTDSPGEIQEQNDWDRFIGMVSVANTIDAVPVIHSEWVWVPRSSHYGRRAGEWRCKRCNGIAHGGLSPYCGKCGARMKAKDGDGNG